LGLSIDGVPVPTTGAGCPTCGGKSKSKRKTTVAADSEKRPELEKVANDPKISDQIDKSWDASNPDGPGAKQENGFWVMRDQNTGELSTQPFTTNATRDSIVPGATPSIEGQDTVAFFHTHPNTAADGYLPGPSPADVAFANNRGVPGIIQSHDGLYFFGPQK
jgi:hypothetical protein